MSTVPFTEEDVKAYLDECIVYWRKTRNKKIKKVPEDMEEFKMSVHYIDAFQSVRTSLFGELLPAEEK